jgi:hypothetical protein
MAADVKIDIAAEFTGKKAFKQAETATEKMTKNVKQLAASIGLAYSGTQVLAFAKASVRAAAADEKAQQQLALALKNVGLGRDAATSESYIQRLQTEFGIVDDLLRPAYQTLAIATRDTAESQRLLNLSLDISAATGKDLGAVTTALSRAYLGNNTALTRLGVGISKADLKTKSFYEITTDLADTFKGSATAAASTFQGSIDKLAVASANVQEIIGTGLIDALKGLGQENSVADLAESMQDAALYTADVIRGIGLLTEKIKALPGVGTFRVGMIPIVGSYLEILRGMGKSKGGGFPQGPPSDLLANFSKTQSTSGSNSQTKIQKETLKINKESLKLAKARAIFDLQKIQIEAALRGKISSEDQIRLKLMKAIVDENTADVDKYEKALDAAQTKTKELSTALAAIKASEAANPFAKWADYVKEAIELTNTVAQASLKAGIDAGASLSQALSGARYAAQGAAAAEAAANAAAIAGAYGSAAAAANKAAADQAAALKASQEALLAQSKAGSEALQTQGAEQLEALKKRLAEEAAAYKELMDATAAAAQAALLTGANEYTVGNLAKVASEAAAAAAAAAAASASVGGTNVGTGGTTKIEVTIAGDPFTDPNVVAEKVVEIIRSAGNRGTVDVLGFE